MRYYFHIRIGDGMIQDDHGEMFASPDAALEEAIKNARQLAHEVPAAGDNNLQYVEVVSEEGRLLFAVPIYSRPHTNSNLDQSSSFIAGDFS